MSLVPVWNIVKIDVCDSTNNLIKKSLSSRQYPHGTVLVTQKQTAGRGRLDRSWESPAGNIALSCVLELPANRVGTAYQLALVAGLALTQTLGQFLPNKDVTQKWPNDVLVNGRKVAGILCELEDKTAIIGIGINWNSQLSDYSPEIRPTLTTIKDASGSALKDEAFFETFLPKLTTALQNYFEAGLKGILPDINQQLAFKEKVVTIIENNKKWAVTILGLSDEGKLRFRMADGTIKEVLSCEIVLP